MVYLADTNVLLRFAERRHPLHSTVRAAVRTLRQDGHELKITPQNCAEFWNVATRPITRNGFGLDTRHADRMLGLIERLFPLLPDSTTQYTMWRRLVVRYGVSGVQVHDARLAAVMLAHGITHILTFNVTDFVRYAAEGIIAVDPETV